ncbi:MAG: hypothetical protein IKK33_16645 [Lachnospiraceae bacterium]|nr:hypothetical protein [Lachnospiraceae bacterium]
MQKFRSAIYTKVFSILKYMAFLFTLLLLLSTLIFTCYIEDMGTQKVLTRTDNILFSILGLGLFLLLLKLAIKWTSKNTSFRSRLFLGLTMGWYIFASAILLVFCRTAPGGDAMTVFRIAEQFAVNDFSAIHPTASYLSYYPHQIGLVAYYEILLRLWNLLPVSLIGFHFIKVINVFWTCLMILCQYKTIDMLFHNYKINITYLLLMICNVPFLFYTSFVYGEIPSISLFSLGYLCILKVFEKEKDTNTSEKKLLPWGYMLLSFVAFIGCMMLRKNAMILMIAVMGVVLFECIRYGKRSFFCMLVVYALITFLTLPTIQKIYVQRAGNELSSGVTALSYIAMGMQESNRAQGWYNGFNLTTYENSGLNKELANKVSREAIAERSLFFKENPSHAVEFYAGKYLSQWCDGTYACLQATLNNLGGRRQVFVNLYSGKYDLLFIPFCNLIQLLLYLGCAVFAFLPIRNKADTTLSQYSLYLGIIGVFGAFLFHMFWEANSRYIFPYTLLLYPYAAYGWISLMKALPGRHEDA